MTELLERHERRPGTPQLKPLLADFAAHGETRTRSDAEALLLHLCLDHGRPRPIINHINNGHEIDATWSGHDLLVEIDSWQHHRDRRTFGRDRATDRAALLAGRPTARYIADDLEYTPLEVATELRALLQATRRDRR